jgi:hypothetical protein
MTLLIFRLRYVSDCPSQQVMPLFAGPQPQQPCKFSSLSVGLTLRDRGVLLLSLF